jgi:hypothetical protein
VAPGGAELPDLQTLQSARGGTQAGQRIPLRGGQEGLKAAPGSPRGLHRTFANIYSSVAATIRSKCDNYEPDGLEQDFPTVYDGAKGVHFIEKAVESSRSEKK